MMDEFDRCEQCEGEVTADSEFCPHCGTLFESAGHPECDLHPGTEATGVCIICRKLVCGLCGVSKSGRMLCLMHSAVKVREDYAEVYRSTDINNVELARSVLEGAGVNVVIQNYGSTGYTWDGGGESALSRSALGRPAVIFVPIPEYSKAVEILNDWSSTLPQ